MTNARFDKAIIQDGCRLRFGGEVLKGDAVLSSTRGICHFAAVDSDIIEEHRSRIFSIEVNCVWATRVIRPDLNVSNSSGIILDRRKRNRVRIPWSNIKTQVVDVFTEVLVLHNALGTEKLSDRSSIESRGIWQQADIRTLRSRPPQSPVVAIDC